MIFKCKMCGGTIEFKLGDTVGVCDSCGTKQTLPRLDDEKKANLYDRANHFRRNNDFDKAMVIYEQILNEDGTDAEVYWSLVLCRYGIEYVEDPTSHKRVPTVNRAQFTSIFADEDCKSALRYADGYQKQIYEEEAKAIDEIQKGILEISSKEEPFDVFICYKETDSNGRRTQDSVIANDLYYELTEEGFKVFFSRITLEDKLGTAYEPYIFAALNSAKVMVVVGTKPEYFNAVWVKNEWSRYLALIKNGAKKMLIPAYRDMDPYDLPEEFSHLQAQDMSKLGFMQDIIRGIKKITRSSESAAPVKETVIVNSGSVNTAPLLKRVFMFLEDGNFKDANDYCEKVLDIDPENAQAYLGKLMAELGVRTKEKLADVAEPFYGNDNYSKVVRFGDSALKDELCGYINHIKKRNEEARIKGIYNSALSVMDTAKSKDDFKAAAYKFQAIKGYKNANELAEECLTKAKEIRKREIEEEEVARLERERKAKEQRIAAEKAAKIAKKIAIIVTPIVCVCIVFIILLTAVIIPNGKYNAAIKLYNEGNIVEAYESLIAMNGYKDSKEKAELMYDEYKVAKLKVASVGDYVVFGVYEQDNDISNGKEDIKWLVLAKEDDKVLVISEKALDYQSYNASRLEVTWKTSFLRKWLNAIFFESAFNAMERSKIQTSNVSADKNPKCDTDPGGIANDKVFLLSALEAERYFRSERERKCVSTAYASARCGFGSSTDWWLRSPGDDQTCAALINDDGSVFYLGFKVDNKNYVRPAMWLNLSA